MKTFIAFVSSLWFWSILSNLIFLPICNANEGDHLWPDARPVVTAEKDQRHLRMISDGQGGAIFVWEDHRNEEYVGGNCTDVYAQRVDASGNEMWGPQGKAIASGPSCQWAPEIASDGAGGAVIAWCEDGRAKVQKIDQSGVSVWSESLDLGESDCSNLSITSNGHGGAFVFWGTYWLRAAMVSSTGTIYPENGGIDLNMPGEGEVVAVKTGSAQLFGYGEAIVFSATGSCTDLQKVAYSMNHTGGIYLPWGDDPVVVGCGGGHRWAPSIAADGNGGVFISWSLQWDNLAEGTKGQNVYIQHVDAEGNALWDNGGVVVVDSQAVGGNQNAWRLNEVTSSVTPDGLGGAVVTWNDFRNEPDVGGDDDIYVQRFDENGNPLWGDSGKRVYFYSKNSSERRPKVVTVGNGASYIVWQHMGLGSWDIFGVKLDGNGNPWSNFSYYIYYDNFPYSTIADTDPQVVFDGSGPSPTGAIVAWLHETSDNNIDIYAQKIELHKPKPDLVVDSIIFDPPAPLPNEPFSVEIRAKNQGNEATDQGFHMGIWGLSEEPIGFPTCYYSSVLGPGETGSCTIDFPDGKPAGTYEVTACVDCYYMYPGNNVIDESDETNNEMNTTLVVAAPDTDPPQPDPMTWETTPYPNVPNGMYMAATPATDASPPIEYYFQCMTTGCNDSGWQSENEFQDSGLAFNTYYSWRVRARDSLNNQTAWSNASGNYTQIEQPSGVAFDFDDIGTDYIKAKVPNNLSNLDQGNSGVIIYNSTLGTSSGWMHENIWWKSDGLAPNTRYSFWAKARNGSGRETAPTSTFYKFTLAAQPLAAPFSPIVTRDSIQANWYPNSNPPTTEYFCENTVNGHSSGWIRDTTWKDTGLSCGTLYSYRVKARNGDGQETPWTDLGSKQTQDCPNVCKADFDRDGDVDGRDLKDFSDHLGSYCSLPWSCVWDLNGDHYVNDADLAIFVQGFGRTDCIQE